ncbi:hypothetical protein NEOLEDRAFT_1244051 [Neolentinus lepideus HHB14362 ss-1]|uniref:Uncharacterized protein n=1 Tax=Neolentinus lepideus HHB14362 ss-1 TaxID=1314782 RepID=A0A165QBE8_9AGAM|nr:hypothetical protein NEOLEDRAFT_1244051 [Neolentinus lepideus HHB14362 ss-1]
MAKINDQQWRILYCALSMFLYGLYTMLFVISIYILVFQRRSFKIRKGLFAVNVSLFLITTVLNILFFLWAYILNITSVFDLPCSQAKIEKVITSSLGVASVAINCVTDGLLVLRCFVVWGARYWVVVVPSLLLLSQIVFGVILMVGFATQPTEMYGNHPTQENYFNTFLYIGNSVLYILSFVTNALLTILIAGRIWWVDRISVRTAGRETEGHYRRAMLIIIESGAVYSAILLVTFVLIVLGNPGANLANVLQSQTAGIFPTAIIVVVGLGMTMDHENAATATLPRMTFRSPSRCRHFDPPAQFINLDVTHLHKESSSVGADTDSQSKERDDDTSGTDTTLQPI